jgi:hypothetical protein
MDARFIDPTNCKEAIEGDARMKLSLKHSIRCMSDVDVMLKQARTVLSHDKKYFIVFMVLCISEPNQSSINGSLDLVSTIEILQCIKILNVYISPSFLFLQEETAMLRRCKLEHLGML